MSGQQEMVREFDEQGRTISEGAIEEAAGEEVAATEGADGGEALAQAAAAEGHKYRFKGKTFATQDEALAYAEQHISSIEAAQEVTDAYRQGMLDAIPQPAANGNVTPAEPEINVDEFYTNPAEFVGKLKKQVKDETLHEVRQGNAIKEQSDSIWREFTDKYPELSDFRGEVEGFVGQNLQPVQALIATKGRPASFDWIALKLKERFAKQAEVLKPRRELSNSGAGPSPAAKGASVTPKESIKKALSFNEQVMQIRKKARPQG